MSQDEDAVRMMDLFRGYDGAHGTHGKTERNPEKHDKLEIKKTARTVHEPVTLDLWKEHLSGERPIGIIPITRENTSVWGCIDIDKYDIDHAEVVRKLKELKLTCLLVCKTKSGGAHVYMFLTEPVPSGDVQAKLRDLAALIGYGGSEIFPKQSTVLTERGDMGNWLNMPYFGGDKSERYCVNETGRGYTLRQFMSLAEAARLTPEEMINLKGPNSNKEDKYRDGPPCLQHLASTSFPEGTRNNGLFAFTTYLKKKYPDKWENKVDEINQESFVPPLQSEEVQQIKKSQRGKEYKYKCSDMPLANHCNSGLCRTRKYGVGASGTMPTIESLAMLNTDEPIFFLDVSGRRVELSTVELQTPVLFQRKCMEVIHTMVPVLKKVTWDAILQGLFENMTIIEASADVSVSGQFKEHLETFCTDRQQASVVEEILLGKAWHNQEDQRIYFRLRDIQDFLDKVKFRGLTRTQMSNRIKDMGGGTQFFNAKGKGINCFWIPAAAFEIQKTSHDLPSIKEDVL